uniref:C2H2-type domain-containing protein n=1 Tax=Caenorhabditis japonica TaxID=281687 RepID=A0A8R1I0F3_CAEJA
MHQNAQKPAEDEEVCKNLKCSMCDKTFPRLSHLQRHQMTHLNVRNFACEFCDEKFVQKAHLTRHVTRKHADESSVPVTWMLCDRCGKLFKTAYELKRHRETVHIRARCRKCGEAVEGNSGMYKHMMKCRNESNVCSNCSASFARLADLTAHETSCLKKVAFTCTPCDEYFKQRVQLDRHILSHHFEPVTCSNCEQICETPVENQRHALDCRKIVICGYCNRVEPEPGHVAENHWRRLKRAMKVKRARRETEKLKRRKLGKEERAENKGYSLALAEDVDAEEDDDDVEEIKEEGGEEEDEKIEETPPFDYDINSGEPSSSSSQFDFTSTAFADDTNPQDFLTFSICPNATDLKFDLKGRLPAELVELFPSLDETSIVLLHSTTVPVRFSVQVQVDISKNHENEREMREWLKEPIYVQ